MRVLILESNLMWRPRLVKTVQALGHEPVLDPEAAVDAAILNLSDDEEELRKTVEGLKAAGVFTIAHAGHKEGQKLDAGRDMGCDLVISNSSATYRLQDALDKAANR